MPGSRFSRAPLILLVLAAVGVLVALAVARRFGTPEPMPRAATPPLAVVRRPTIPGNPAARERALRERLYAALQPVRLANCTLERIGEPRDGGYLMCANLLQAESGYSYGISGYDGWGCRISTQLKVPVHQYDCFDQRHPRCEGGDMRFHPECVAGKASTDPAGRPFDTLTNQIARNGDSGRRVIMKMDVEGAEWDSLLETPAAVLERIDQLSIEMHGNNRDTWKQFLVVSKLKDQFHVVNLHFNNYACRSGQEPFPSWAWEVLFVNKRLGVVADDQQPLVRPHPLDAPNNPNAPDCQYVADGPGARPK
jgi:hypothetical protein